MKRILRACVAVLGAHLLPLAAPAQSLDPALSLPSDIASAPPSERAAELVGRIIGAVSLPPNFELREVAIDQFSAAAGIVEGKRVIYYSLSFLARLDADARDWSALGLLAHEVGHHLAGHTEVGHGTSAEGTRFRELQADEWAGWSLGLFALEKPQVREAVLGYVPELGPMPVNSGYPSVDDRVAAAEKGWANFRTGFDSTSSAIACHQLLEAMDVLWEHFDRVGWMCSDPATFLDWAGSGRPDVLRLLVSLGMDPNLRGEGGVTALHRVVGSFRCRNMQESVEFLLSAGADPLAKDEDGYSPIAEARFGGNMRSMSGNSCEDDGWFNSNKMFHLARFLLDSAVNRGALELHFYTLLNLAESGTPNDLANYEINGYKGTEPDDDGNTVLHRAVRGCNLPNVEYLIGSRDNYRTSFLDEPTRKAKNEAGQNAMDLAMAVRDKCPEVADYLSQHWWWDT